MLMEYHGVSWSIMDHHGPTWTIMDHHGPRTHALMHAIYVPPQVIKSHESIKAALQVGKEKDRRPEPVGAEKKEIGLACVLLRAHRLASDGT